MLFVGQTALTERAYQQQMMKRPLLFSRKHLHVGPIKKGTGPNGKALFHICLAQTIRTERVVPRHQMLPCGLLTSTLEGDIWQLLVQLGNHYINHTA